MPSVFHAMTSEPLAQRLRRCRHNWAHRRHVYPASDATGRIQSIGRCAVATCCRHHPTRVDKAKQAAGYPDSIDVDLATSNVRETMPPIIGALLRASFLSRLDPFVGAAAVWPGC